MRIAGVLANKGDVVKARLEELESAHEQLHAHITQG